MGWLTKVMVLAALQYAGGMPRSPLDDESTGVLQQQQQDDPEYAAARLEDEKLAQLENFLGELIMMPWNGKAPLLYVENGGFDEEQEMAAMPYKRSRYYRKYPWKRQNSRRNTGGTRYFCTQDKEKGFKGAVVYDAENPYLCTPSKDDVVRLLVALHEARGGNRGRTVDFCNRKRPASSIFTNIRFLG